METRMSGAVTGSDLTCVLFPDLLPWERQSAIGLLDALSTKCRVVRWDFSSRSRRLILDSLGKAPVWVVAGNWSRALEQLRLPSKTKVFVSVMGPGSTRTPLAALFLRRLKPWLSESVHLVAHSPLNYRFFLEIQGIPAERLSHLPLPIPSFSPSAAAQSAPPDGDFVVGAVSRFSSEANLNYFLNVAHYVHYRQPKVRFQITGIGGLESHLRKMAKELDLGEACTIVAAKPEPVRCDLLVYSPLRNDHFLPVLLAGSKGIPVLASELPGVQAFIADGKEGFIVPVNETRPMGELILRLMDDSLLRTALGQRLSESLLAKYAEGVVAPAYESLFFLSGASAKVSQAA